MEVLSNEITGIIAPKGSGKTHYACQLVLQSPRVAVFDTICEVGYALVCDELIFSNPRALAEELEADRFRVAYRTTSLENGFKHYAECCYLRGDLRMVLEEADRFCSPYYRHPSIEYLVRLGRHRKVSLTFVCRRWSEISRDLTANSNQFVFFQTFEPRDLEGISERCGVQVADQVRGLRRLRADNTVLVPGEVLVWRDDGSWEVRDLARPASATERAPKPDAVGENFHGSKSVFRCDDPSRETETSPDATGYSQEET